MVSEKEASTQKNKNEDIRYLYAFGNIASIVGPVILALIGHYTDWKTVFLLLSMSCLLGALILYRMSPKLQKSFFTSKTFCYKNVFFVMAAPLGLSLVIHFQFLKWFLTGFTALWAFTHLQKSYLRSTRHTQLILQRLFLLGPSIILFFALQSQEFFLMPLYIERFVIKDFGWITLQTPWFHSINPVVAIFMTPFLARINERRSLEGAKIPLKSQILLAFFLLAIKFFLMALSTHLEVTAPFVVALAYSCTGTGIILLVPTAYQYIVKVKDMGLKRILIGSLYLMMVFAYLGTTFMSHLVTEEGSTHTLSDYKNIFYGFTGVAFIVLGVYYISMKAFLVRR